MNVLSIDWDYFINASAAERYKLFPDGGNENIPRDVRKFVWSGHYLSDELKNITIKQDDLNKTIEIIQNNFDNLCGIMIADSHRHIYDFIGENIKENEKLNIINIDFHHDLYEVRKADPVNCGNWGNKILSEYNSKISWINQNDSDLHDNIKLDILKIDDIQDFPIDFLYICKSEMWSPPHLDGEFTKAFRPLIQQDEIEVKLEVGIFDTRYDFEFINLIEEQKKLLKNSHFR